MGIIEIKKNKLSVHTVSCLLSDLNFKMRYVAAYMLAVLGGNEAPSSSDLKAIIESVGVGFDDEQASTVVDKLAGKSIDELIAAGAAQMSSMPAGGAVAAGGAAAGGAAAEEDAPKEEAKKEESEEESDDDMGFGLFD